MVTAPKPRWRVWFYHVSLENATLALTDLTALSSVRVDMRLEVVWDKRKALGDPSEDSAGVSAPADTNSKES